MNKMILTAALGLLLAGVTPAQDGCHHGCGDGCPGPKGCTTPTHGCFGEKLEGVANTFQNFAKKNRAKLEKIDLEDFLTNFVNELRKNGKNAPEVAEMIRGFEEFLGENRGKLKNVNTAVFLEKLGGELLKIRENNLSVQRDVDAATRDLAKPLAHLVVENALDHLQKAADDSRRGWRSATDGESRAWGSRPFDNAVLSPKRAQIWKDSSGKTQFGVESSGSNAVDVRDLGPFRQITKEDIKKLNEEERNRELDRLHQVLRKDTETQRKLEQIKPVEILKTQAPPEQHPTMFGRAEKAMKKEVDDAVEAGKKVLQGGHDAAQAIEKALEELTDDKPEGGKK